MVKEVLIDRLHSCIKEAPPRGGASILQVENKVLIFGGADRELCHFQDLFVYSVGEGNVLNGKETSSASVFRRITSMGDVPTPRSGHAVAAYGKYMFLFGGIDFHEEVAFNDLYMLDTSTYRWYYVGESGCEVDKRNSHTLAVLSTLIGAKYLVIYGGASPEKGPLGDTIFASLPLDAQEIAEPSAFFVKWEVLRCPGPSSREMHGHCSDGKHLFIMGGRDAEGRALSDVWILCPTEDINPIDEPPAKKADVQVFSWMKRFDMEMKIPCCALGATIIRGIGFEESQGGGIESMKSKESNIVDNTLPIVERENSVPMKCGVPHENPPPPPTHSTLSCPEVPLETSSSNRFLCVVGGFTGTEVIEDIWVFPLQSDLSFSAESTMGWSKLLLQKSFGPRFGLTLCGLSSFLVKDICSNKNYAPVLSTKIKTEIARSIYEANVGNALTSHQSNKDQLSEKISGMLLFGGVDARQDYGDVWLLVVS